MAALPETGKYFWMEFLISNVEFLIKKNSKRLMSNVEIQMFIYYLLKIRNQEIFIISSLKFGHWELVFD